MEEINKSEFYRRAVRVGNSAGILLPKSLLGAEVSVKVVKPAVNIKKDILKIMDNLLEEIMGIYVLTEKQEKENKNIKRIFKNELNLKNISENNSESKEKSKRKIEVIAVSMALSKTLETQDYHLTIMPLNLLKKLAKDKPDFSQKLFHSKPLMNKWLLVELRKEMGF
ncbi:hypothetical protein J4466_05130 [Candidatus Pacearchaeota archaeon]|nr:hypothetical protein [Candidatus Pacearchaeota archaeon]